MPAAGSSDTGAPAAAQRARAWGPVTGTAAHGRASARARAQGAIATAGAAVSWLRDGLGLIDGVDELEPLARSVDGTAGARGPRARPSPRPPCV